MSRDALRILILEDVPMDAELVEYELERAQVPFVSRRVDNRNGFLQELETFQPQVILSDYTLPNFDGMSALSLARERAPSVPFLIVTGSVNEETAVDCIKAGATDYLLKSNLARIAPAIQAALERERAQAEKIRTDQALRESEERYRDLFDNASDLVCMVDPGGALLYVNQAWHAGLGYGPEEIADLHLIDVIHSDSAATYESVMKRVLRGERLDHVELVLVPKAAAAITVEGNLSCTFKDGIPSVVRGIYRDITERKRVEDQLRRAERMQAAGKLAGGVAHEVNNMMTGVLGFSEFVLRSFDPEDPRREDMEEVIRAASRAADVTRQLLAFTRQQYLQPQTIEINTVVREVERMLRRSLGEDKQLELRLSERPGLIKADRGQLEQVLINLVLNARDAIAPHGRVSIETGSSEWDSDYAERHGGVDLPLGRYVMLAVSDDGCGMDSETQARIFEPFFTTKPVGQGTGLGLSTVYGIVKQSGGFVWAYSEPDHGTVFKVYLPEVQEAELDFSQELSRGPAEHGSETILVIEDEDVVRNLAVRGLRDYGYTVVEAKNGVEALSYIRRYPGAVDLIVSDVVMPEMGGREFAQQLALLEPDLPILFMSGYTGDDVVQRGLLEPGAPFQQKPFTPAILASKVRAMLDQVPQSRAVK
jgi:two-component system, cell cycle sensor histidine kinase and response regulator CckA